MVREYQHSRRHDLLLAVELWLPVRPRPADFERVELAVSFAASICVDQLQFTSDSAIDLVVSGHETSRSSGWTGATSLGGILERLALAEGGPAAGLAAEIGAASGATSRVRKVLVTSRPAGGADAERRIPFESRSDFGDEQFEVFEAEPENVLRFVEYVDREAGETP